MSGSIVAVEEWLGGKVQLEPGGFVFENAPAAGVRDNLGCVRTPFRVRTKLREGEGWAVFACGEKHSAGLTSLGAAYTWGCAEDGRLGLPLDERARSVDAVVYWPTRVDIELTCHDEEDVSLLRPAMVDCGDDFTAFVSEDGKAYGCGANYRGQLGFNEGVEECALPTQLLPQASELGGIDFLSCGGDHMAAVDGLGQLWVWGGLEDTGERWTTASKRFGLPHVVRMPRRARDEAEEDDDDICEISLVACGTGMVMAVTDDGDAYTWGDGACGRLGLGDGCREHSTPQPLPMLSAPEMRIQMVACGKAVSEENEEGPAVLILAVPETVDQLSAQYDRFFLKDAPKVW
mmetsp:Transcript_55114/g.109425  ORF Transcript_55114/g.109425 Transcript_55114/m.109425 type:complete len:347 (-) Transcript_55114:114-1154(-)